jgi:hypothetical protein
MTDYQACLDRYTPDHLTFSAAARDVCDNIAARAAQGDWPVLDAQQLAVVRGIPTLLVIVAIIWAVRRYRRVRAARA